MTDVTISVILINEISHISTSVDIQRPANCVDGRYMLQRKLLSDMDIVKQFTSIYILSYSVKKGRTK